MAKICILGAGASALMCASCISKNNQVVLIDKNTKIGKKILATGNGRCNLTNLKIEKDSYNVDLTKYLNVFSSENAIKFFESIGVQTYADEENRVYPITNSAQSVLDCLENILKNNKNIAIISQKTIKNVRKNKNKFIVEFLEGENIECDKVVFAMGNLTDLDLAKNFASVVKPFKPSLCALKTNKHKTLSGIRISPVKVSCKLNSRNFSEVGEVLFKDEGLSGIVIFNLSAFIARENNFDYEVVLDLMPNIDNLEKILKNRQKILKNASILTFFDGFLVKPVANFILKETKIDEEKNVQKLTENEIKILAKTIKNLKFKVKGTYDNSQVSSGGVSLSSLSENLESKTHSGVYFIGEACDVDGLCGGYNLQWAWTSGYIVGKSL